MADTKIKPHERVNDILLGPLERPALKWLAAHQPAWMTPDKLTLIGTFGAFLIAAAYWLSSKNIAWLWVVNLGFLINWFGDSLDGTLARYRKIERPRYGFFVDHTVDALNEVVIVLGLGLSPFVRFEIAALALIGYLLMSVLVYVRTYVDGVFKISYGKFGPTEVRVLVVLVNIIIFFFGNPAFELFSSQISAFDLFAGGITLVLFVVFVVSTAQQALALAKLE